MSAPSTAERVGEEVRVLMLRRRKTQSDLAETLGLSQAAVGRRLTGAVPFDVNELTVLAAFLGVPIGALLPEGAAA